MRQLDGRLRSPCSMRRLPRHGLRGYCACPRVRGHLARCSACPARALPVAWARRCWRSVRSCVRAWRRCLDLVGFDERVRDVDLVITVRGNMDEQSAAVRRQWVWLVARSDMASRWPPSLAVAPSTWMRGMGRASTLYCPICRKPMDWSGHSIRKKPQPTSSAPASLPREPTTSAASKTNSKLAALGLASDRLPRSGVVWESETMHFGCDAAIYVPLVDCSSFGCSPINAPLLPFGRRRGLSP